MTDKRCVLAVDPLTSGVSFSKITEGNPTPYPLYAKAPTVVGKPTLAEAAARIKMQVDHVVETVSKFEPELVVMPRLFLGTMKNDPSGPRRAGLYWMTVEGLTAAGIPVADFPTMTVERYAGHIAEPGHSGVARLEKSVFKIWPGVERNLEPYRYSTVMFAAVAAAAVGIPTALEITPDRLRYLVGGTWPKDLRVPRKLHEWQTMHGTALKLGKTGDEKKKGS